MLIKLTLNTDMRLLVYTAFVCIVIWIPYILAGIRTFGLARMAGYPAVDYKHLPQWSQRLHRAHMNLVENIGPFAALIIIAQLTGAAGEMTAWGARLFFWARLAQIGLHWAGVPYGRTVTFAVGWIGNLLIFAAILAK